MKKEIKFITLDNSISYSIDSDITKNSPINVSGKLKEHSIRAYLYKLLRAAYNYNLTPTDEFKQEFLDTLKTLEDVPKELKTSSLLKRQYKQTKVTLGYLLREQELSYLKALKDNNESYSHYVNFLNLLYTNPIKSIRENAFKVVIENKLPITSQGYLVGVRQVWKYSTTVDGTLEDFIKSETVKVKKVWKKSISKFNVYKKVDELENTSYFLVKDDNPLEEGECLGSLDSLQDFKAEVQEVYTDDYTKRMRWKLGDVCRINRSFSNTEVSCGSQMLHIRTNPKELHGYGDTNILVLIHPRDIISTVAADWKIGVCEFYFAAILDKKEIPSIFDKEFSLFENDYIKKDTVDVLKDIAPVYEGEFSEENYKAILENRVTWI